jgi:hypothetical protein
MIGVGGKRYTLEMEKNSRVARIVDVECGRIDENPVILCPISLSITNE